MLRIEIYKTVKSLVRISEKKWRDMIHIKSDQRVWMIKETLSIGYDRYS